MSSAHVVVNKDGQRRSGIYAAAQARGLSLDEYVERVKTEKFCTFCKEWLPRARFNRDASRGDGLKAKCKACAAGLYRPVLVHKRMGPEQLAERDGDKKQARRRVNLLVRSGRLAHPNTAPCFDCGHTWKAGERRHEYDHYKGYGRGNHLAVQAVCTVCHYKRERARK